MFEFLGVTIDFSFWINFLNSPLLEQVGIVFVLGGWVFFVNFIFKKVSEMWVAEKSAEYTSKWKWVLLAVDVPPLFVQTPKAVEQIFAHLSGALISTGVKDKFLTGKKQKSFSFEIISIEGYIQFLVRTEEEFRDLVESSIYAQYPEAEITEVEDYIDNVPDSYPNDEYDCAGMDFKMSQDSAFPIRTYQEFAYSLSKDAVFSDPMAAILENFTRIAQGENLWMQMVVEPAGSSWKDGAIETAKALLKGGAPKKKSSGFNPLSILGSVVSFFITEILGAFGIGGGGGEKTEKKEEKPDITPGTRKNAEAIEDKVSKIGMKTKIRLLYAARKEVFNPGKCVTGFVGAMNQFSIQNRNAIVPGASAGDPKSKAEFVKAYKGRKMKWKNVDGYIMNIEELATVWHFPLPFVKTPLLKKAGYKRSEPPAGLPIEMQESPLKPKGSGEGPNTVLPPEPPEDLPYG